MPGGLGRCCLGNCGRKTSDVILTRQPQKYQSIPVLTGPQRSKGFFGPMSITTVYRSVVLRTLGRTILGRDVVVVLRCRWEERRGHLQLGCLTASAAVTSLSLSTGQSRKAPPEAVRMIRRRPPSGSPCRHWKIACKRGRHNTSAHSLSARLSTQHQSTAT